MSLANSTIFAILTLFDTDEFKSDPDWIAQRLNLNPSLVRKALDRLKRLEILTEDSSEKLKKQTLNIELPTI